MKKIKTIAVIPARYQSSRFPGKPLIDIAGKTMLQRVFEQVQASAVDKVLIATDDERIQAHAHSFGATVAHTGMHHNGTARCREAFLAQETPYDIMINIQGDEPFIRPQQINDLIAAFEHPTIQIASLCKKIEDQEVLFNPDVVKVALGPMLTPKAFKALYFSRSTIPYIRDVPLQNWLSAHTFYKHLGVYAFRRSFLTDDYLTIQTWVLEQAECLEQLAWLESGKLIALIKTDFESVNIDRPEDIAKALEFLKKNRLWKSIII